MGWSPPTEKLALAANRHSPSLPRPPIKHLSISLRSSRHPKSVLPPPPSHMKVTDSAEDDGSATAKRKKKKKWSDEIRVDLTCCKYEILRIVIQKMGWQEAADDTPWHLLWTDTSIGPDRLLTLRRGQKVNHFLGMLQICRKKSLARHLSNMRRMFPAEYKFFPRAFILPNHIQELIMRLNSEKLRTYILKPDNGCQGRGVVLVQNVADLKQAIGGMAGSNMLAQKYLTSPMLLNGYKFDLRIYALILSCDPLRLFLYREGIARFCTEKYMKPDKGNLKLSCMHLTNYAVNKNNTKFEFNKSVTETDKGSKWTLSSLFKALAARGHDTGKLKRQIRKMVVMTIIAIVPLLVHNYKTCLTEDDNGRSCFELLGMDVLLDDKCRPWLLEVNHSPSFAIDTPLDFKVKESLLCDTFRLLNLDPSVVSRYRLQDKKGSKMRLYGQRQNSKEEIETLSPKPQNCQEGCSKILEFDEFECKNLGNFDRIYPPEDENLLALYNIFLSGSEEAFKQSFDMKVKNAILKAQETRKREEMEKEAAERKNLKKRQDVRKRAQESAKMAALSQQQSNSISNHLKCNDDDMLKDFSKRFIFDMASPHSSIETPTGWERARSTLDRVSDRGKTGQQGENKLAESPIRKKGVFEGVKCPLYQEEFTGRYLASENRTIPTPGKIRTQSIKCTTYPYNFATDIPMLSSLPCIVPQVFCRHQQRKVYYSRVCPQSKIPELDGETPFIRSHYLPKTPFDVKRNNIPVTKTATFLLTRRYHGTLPKLSGPPLPKYNMDPSSFGALSRKFV